MAFIVLWLTTGFIISVFTRPDFSPPTPSFMICAHKIGGDDRMLPVYPVQAYQDKPQDFKLCQAPFEYHADNGYSHLTLTQDPKSGQYLLSTHNDSTADPVEYVYQITDDKIEPISWRRGGNMAKMVSYFYGFVLSMILHRVGKRFYRHKQSL